ncbi:MAG: sodium:proton antiporter [Acidobacteriaceae bacterium]|jgi:CPA1 family monovalent cation:H+ antiporter|nr:sodium:proton antiporter [Acidobacteriaceae bacterium]
MTPLALVSLLLCTAALFGWISSRWLKLPITIGTMALTGTCSIALIVFGEHTPGLQAWATGLVQQINFERLILHGMLPLLLFAGAFLLDLKLLAREKLVVTILSLFGTVFAAALVAVLMHWGLLALGINAGWLSCLFFGALISPTDPIAVLEMLRRVGVPGNVQAQLAGESLFNDGVGAVLFLALLDASRGATPTISQVALSLVVKAGGGLALGIITAWPTSALMRRVQSYQVEILFTLSLAMGGYALAELLHVSAPLEAVAAALALRRFNMNHPRSEIAHESIDKFWELVDEVQNSILFVLLGLEVLAISFPATSQRSGLTAIVVVTGVRFAIVALLIGLIRLLRPQTRSSILILSWGGLRGGLSIALALLVPASAGRTWILATTYIVVVFSIALQGGSMDLFLKRWNLSAGSSET